MLLRDLAAGRHARWLDSLVLLIAPIYNADGNERVSLTSRPLQFGPIGGQGVRPNAAGLDLNRDHMKLESPEARSQVLMLRRYDPHVAMDLHTTDGSVHGYHLTYAEPLHPATDAAIPAFVRGEWLPRVTGRIKQTDGWDFFYYGNFPDSPVDRGAGGNERGWYSFDARPRFSENYWGLRNRVGILSEAYSYASFEERIRATLRFVEESLEFAWANAGRIRSLTEAADARRLTGDSLPLRARLKRGPDLPILRGEVADTIHPHTGQRMLRRLDVRRPEPMPDYTTFEGAEFERVPRTYYVPAALRAVAERLAAHGIVTSRLEQPMVAQLERYRIDSTWTAAREFQGHRERQVRGAWEAATDSLAAGTNAGAAGVHAAGAALRRRAAQLELHGRRGDRGALLPREAGTLTRLAVSRAVRHIGGSLPTMPRGPYGQLPTAGVCRVERAARAGGVRSGRVQRGR
jgi:hypothetical protein